MTTIGGPAHPAVEIGEVSAPPFVRLPDPATLFGARAERLKAIAEGHAMEGFLYFMADVAEAQHRIARELSDPREIDPAGLDEALERLIPLLSKTNIELGRDYELILHGILTRLASAAKPEAAEEERQKLLAATAAWRESVARDLLGDVLLPENAGVSLYVAAALQVLFARLASTLPAGRMRPVGDGICPSCGSHPVSSAIVGWKNAHGTRFLHCALCATYWNYTRIKCARCASTMRIAYWGLHEKTEFIKAETCEECKHYLKIMHQHKDTSLDPVADDLASYGLDLKIQEDGWRRFGYNPFLLDI